MSYAVMCLMWGSTWIMIKIGVSGAPPLTTLAVRFLIAALIGGILLLLRGTRVPMTRHFLILSSFLGVVHQTAGYVLVYWAEQFIDSGLTAVLYSTMPFAVAIISRIMLGDPLTPPKIAGILAGIAGVWLVFADTARLGDESAMLGVAAVLGSVACASLSSVVVKKYATEYDPLTMLFLPILIGGTVVSIAAALIERSNPLHYSAGTWGTIVYLAVVGSVGAFTLFYWVVKRMDVTVLSYQTFIIPVIAVVLGWLFLDETISARVAVGALVIVAGIVTATAGARRWEARKK
jgi:drug/metabolite transporter (DMT)-like permease